MLLLALALTHLVGLADVVLGDECDQVCQDDDCGTDCGPGATCRCHCPSSMPAIAAVQLVATIEAPEPVEACREPHRAYPSPDPREILRVPKRAA